MNADLTTAVSSEITSLHQAFEDVFGGDPTPLALIEERLDPDFVLLGPNGEEDDRDTIMTALAEAVGRRRLRIEVEDVVVRAHIGDLVVATYVEIHSHDDYRTERTSTAVLISSGHGWRWRLVHETWRLPPPSRRPAG